MPRRPRPPIAPLGDRALVVTLGDAIDEATYRRVRAVCARLDARPVAGMLEYVPAFASVTVYYDPAAGGHARVAAAVEAAVAAALQVADDGPAPAERVVEIPVCYGGAAGPDLDDVARYHGMTPRDVVRLHTEADYRAHMVGFAPGFAYLGGLPERLATPRRATPRERVPASSVAIGGGQTGVYSIDSPGGWHVIGRTPLRLFAPDRDPPTLLRAGDRVRFRAITPDDAVR